MTTRNTRPEPRTFEHFPDTSQCPVCGTNDDGPAVLVPIDGTDDDGICQAACVHLDCCIPTNFNRNAGLMYLRATKVDA